MGLANDSLVVEVVEAGCPAMDKSGSILHRLVRRYDHIVPVYVKQASRQDILPDDRDLPTISAADPMNKRYWCSTPAATWASWAFYLNSKQADAIPKSRCEQIESRLSKFAGFFGIQRDIDALKQAIEADKPKGLDELPDSVFLVNDPDYGRRLPVRNAKEAGAAIAYFKQYRFDVPLAIRQKAAAALFNKISELNYEIDLDTADFLSKQAGYGGGPIGNAVEAISSRARVKRHGATVEDKAALQKLAGELVQLGPDIDMDLRRRLAVALDEFDRKCQLQAKCASGELTPPEDAFFSITKPAAHKFAQEHTLAGNEIYRTKDLEKIAMSNIRDLFGTETAIRVSLDGRKVDGTKMAEEIHSMGVSELDIVRELLADAGVKPAYRVNRPAGFSNSQLAGMAYGD